MRNVAQSCCNTMNPHTRARVYISSSSITNLLKKMKARVGIFLTGLFLQAVNGQSQAMINEFRSFVVGCASPARQWIRVAFHEAGTFRQADRTGGNDGSLRLPAEANAPQNRGLADTIGVYQFLAQKHGISFADAVVVGGIVAVEECGGPRGMPITLGRPDTNQPNDPNRLPPAQATAQQIRDIFIAGIGMTLEETIALIGGGHTVARVESQNSPGLQPGPLDTTTNAWDVNFFIELLAPNPPAGVIRIPADQNMVNDPEMRTIIQQFANNPARFASVFASAYVKMLNLGTNFASTSTVPPPVPTSSTQTVPPPVPTSSTQTVPPPVPTSSTQTVPPPGPVPTSSTKTFPPVPTTSTKTGSASTGTDSTVYSSTTGVYPSTLYTNTPSIYSTSTSYSLNITYALTNSSYYSAPTYVPPSYGPPPYVPPTGDYQPPNYVPGGQYYPPGNAPSNPYQPPYQIPGTDGYSNRTYVNKTRPGNDYSSQASPFILAGTLTYSFLLSIVWTMF